ncbi:MAG: hypothetical protein ACOYO1_11235 [Bacteroidales bacterium]
MKKQTNFFWPSYTDLMTSLFFIMLVLFVITYTMQQNTVIDLEKKLRVYDLVEQNLKPLKEDSALFHYELDYKRFILGFDVEFEVNKYQIIKGELKNYDKTKGSIINAGEKLQNTIDNLIISRNNNSELKNVSYLLIISGSSSHLLSGQQIDDYELSYKRAYNLWYFWKIQKGIDFESDKYQGLIDLQISGNGWGGVGRYMRDPDNNMINETKNQRFIIQIIPKIGKVD